MHKNGNDNNKTIMKGVIMPEHEICNGQDGEIANECTIYTIYDICPTQMVQPVPKQIEKELVKAIEKASKYLRGE